MLETWYALDTKKPVAIAANDRTGFPAMTHGMEPRRMTSDIHARTTADKTRALPISTFKNDLRDSTPLTGERCHG